jgi:SAM-dependent methyltransferase
VEKHEYATMAEFETFYWWYRGLHGTLGDILSGMGVSEHTLVLDAGCGTGGNLLAMNRRLVTKSFGFDFSLEASPFWHERGLKRCVVASINDMPYQSDSFDVTISVDVLESDAVNQCRAVAELWRVTRPGGLILLVAPAYRWLLTEQHHRAVHASRRYSRRELVDLLCQQPVEILRVTHLFATLFPLIATYRLALRLLDRHRPDDEPARSELQRLPSVVNSLFTCIMNVERRVARQVDLPFGSSIIVLGQKLSK